MQYKNNHIHMFLFCVLCLHVSSIFTRVKEDLPIADDPLYPLGQNYEEVTINSEAHKYHIKKITKKILENDMVIDNVHAIYGKTFGKN